MEESTPRETTEDIPMTEEEVRPRGLICHKKIVEREGANVSEFFSCEDETPQ